MLYQLCRMDRCRPKWAALGCVSRNADLTYACFEIEIGRRRATIQVG